MTIDVQKENWLAKIQEMEKTDSWYIHLSNLGSLTAEKANAAIKAMFGEDYAVVHDHGTVLCGIHLPNRRKGLRKRIQERHCVSDSTKKDYGL